MNIKIVFLALLAIQGSYALSADEQTLLTQSNKPASAQLDQVLKPKSTIFGGIIGGAAGGGAASLFSDYCIYSCPLNVTTTAYSVIVGNAALGTTIYVCGGAVAGAVATGVVILAHRYLKSCYGTQKRIEQDIA